MFTGRYVHALDAKGRLMVPMRYRAELQEGFYIISGDDPCLVIYPLGEYRRLSDKVAAMPRSSPTARAFSRRVFGGAQEASLDGVGRVLIAAYLREAAGITDEAVLVGVNTCIEVWQPERLQETEAREAQQLPSIQADMESRGV